MLHPNVSTPDPGGVVTGWDGPVPGWARHRQPAGSSGRVIEGIRAPGRVDV